MKTKIYSDLRSFVFSLVVIILAQSCSSYKNFRYITEEFEMPSELYKADFNQTWKAVIDTMNKFDIALQNLESGVIKTRWMDNTTEVNFADSFGNNDSVKAAKFKLTLNVVKGFRSGKEVTKVTVYKRQLVEQDFLQGWKEVPSDGIQEKVILYRVGRRVTQDGKIKAIDEAKQKEADAASSLQN
jgi:hypothetical protein